MSNVINFNGKKKKREREKQMVIMDAGLKIYRKIL